MSTNYIIGSLTSKVYVQAILRDQHNTMTAVYTSDLHQVSDDCKWCWQTPAQCALFTLEADDVCAAALDLIVIPVADGVPTYQAELPL